MELIINSKLYGAQTVYYDDEDHDLISKYNWYLANGDWAGKKRGVWRKDLLYVKSSGLETYIDKHGNTRRKSISMHGLLLGKKEGFVIDHIDNDPLNNRRINLRFVTQAQNVYNKRPISSAGIEFKGVFKEPEVSKYKASITVNAKVHHLGQFRSMFAAAYVYNEAAKKYFGENAWLNPLTEEQITIAISEINMGFIPIAKSGFVGVYFIGTMIGNQKRPWQARICYNKKSKSLGTFETETEAAIAYNTAVLTLGFTDKKINKIPTSQSVLLDN